VLSCNLTILAREETANSETVRTDQNTLAKWWIQSLPESGR
jgi:hypothetical protein